MHSERQLTADRDQIKRDLSFMTARWHEIGQPAKIELRAFAEGKQAQWAQFTLDRMEEAVEWAASMNNSGRNIYAVRNPIRADAAGSAKDSDIIGSFFLWADCDEPASAGNVARFGGPKYTANVRTGTTPHTRVHVYWELEDFCQNLDAWRDMQVRIAAHFGSDRTVVNPSRIMRVGGTVAHPDSKKQGKGYVSELCTLRTEYSDDRSPVDFAQMSRVFAAAAPQKQLTIDTGPQPLDRERMAIQALAGQEWHNAVIRLVASYVSKGLSDEEIHALTAPLTLPGYTVEQTAAEVQTAINGARAKGWTPEPFTPNFDHSPAPTPAAPAPEAAGWRVQTAGDFTADFVAPEYVIDGIVQRGRLYTLTAPTGSGKTAVMLYASAAIATGLSFCDAEVEQGDVLFMAGENPDDVRARVIATMEFYGIDLNRCRLHFIAGTFSIRADWQRLQEEAAKLPNLILCVVDTFAAYFDGEDENSNAQALDFARVVRKLTTLPSKPAVIMPAHPVKNAARNNLTPKGGSSLVNEVDGNLTLWNSEGMLTLHWQVKHRGPDFEPLKFELQRHESPRLTDRKGRRMPTILAKPLMELRAIQIAREAMTTEDAMLLSIRDKPHLSVRDRCVELGMVDQKGKAQTGAYSRLRDKLAERKLIRNPTGRRWELTDNGKRLAAEVENGTDFADDLEA